jgi:hypothetical protein
MVKFRSVVLGCLLYRVWLMYYFDKQNNSSKNRKKIMNDEKTKFVQQEGKVDLV